MYPTVVIFALCVIFVVVVVVVLFFDFVFYNQDHVTLLIIYSYILFGFKNNRQSAYNRFYKQIRVSYRFWKIFKHLIWSIGSAL